MNLPIAQRMARLRDPETRIMLETRAASPDAGAFGRLTGWDRYVIGDTYSEANRGLSGCRVGDIARQRGQRDFNCLLDIVLADDLRTVLWPGPTDDDKESWRMRAEAWKDSSVMIGGSDAGAHLDRMCGAPYTTQFLADCLRGRQLVTMEEAIRLITDVPSRSFGLRGRGRVAAGWQADLVVFDPRQVDAGPFELRRDLPGGSARLYAAALGVHHVLVNGRRTIADGRCSGVYPCQVLRSARDTSSE